jgi:hypothetical protein
MKIPACAVGFFAMCCAATATQGAATDSYGERSMIVYVPSRLPAPETRALVVVLHGGLGNAERIESQQSENALNMDSVAEKGRFIVAYLNGTPVTRFLGIDKLGWKVGPGEIEDLHVARAHVPLALAGHAHQAASRVELHLIVIDPVTSELAGRARELLGVETRATISPPR